MRAILAVCAALLLTGCVIARNTATIPPARCGDLIPPEWTQGVEVEPIPADVPITGNPLADALAATKQWANAYVGQTGQLSKANGRTVDAIGIVKRCEKMVNEARPKR